MAITTEAPARPGDPSAGAAPARAPIAPIDGTLAGAVAAGMALATGELVCRIAGSGPTLITAVGTQFIDRFAASLKELAVALFDTNDKAALIVGIVVVSLILGAALGRAAVRRPIVAVAGFVAFGAFGLFSYLDDPLGSAGTGVLAAVLAAAAGIGTLLGLLHLRRLGTAAWAVEPSQTTPDVAGAVDGAAGVEPATAMPSDGSRRLFLVGLGSLTAFAAGAAVLGRRLGRTEVVDVARRDVVLPPARPAGAGQPSTFPADAARIDGLTPYVIPNESFYRIDTALVVPQVDVADWRLELGGMVDRPFMIDYDELVAMSTTQETVTLSCVSNEVGGGLVGNAVWQGVPLADLLERAGVQAGATQIIGRSVDNFTAGFPTEVALDGRTALVAVAMNGEPLPAEHGFPARLVIAGLYGYVSATKWLREIELTTWDGNDGYWITRGWSKEGPIKTQSRIDVPRSGQRLPAGRQAIAGVAWSPPNGIRVVEVQIDDGDWIEARLGDTVSDDTWVQWFVEWEAEPGEHVIQVRATDGTGAIQTDERAAPVPNGASGWHRRTVEVR